MTPTAGRRRARATLAIAGCAVLGIACADDGPVARPDVDTSPVIVATVEAQSCDRPRPRRGLGAWIDDATVLTAAHVVRPPNRRLEIDGLPAEVVSIDEDRDLAVVRISDAPTDRISASPLATAAVEVDVGTTVEVHRRSGAVGATVLRDVHLEVDDHSAGLVRSRRSLVLDVFVEPGDSGAPVTDAGGRIIAVAVLRDAAAGTTYATTVDEVHDLFTERTLAAPTGCA